MGGLAGLVFSTTLGAFCFAMYYLSDRALGRLIPKGGQPRWLPGSMTIEEYMALMRMAWLALAIVSCGFVLLSILSMAFPDLVLS